MRTTRQILGVVALGSVVAFFAGLIHVAGSVRLFGADGIRWPGWVVVVLAPPVLFVALTFYQAAGLVAARRVARRRQLKG